MSGARPTPFDIAYRSEPAATLLAQPGTLAVLEFDAGETAASDPRHLRVPLQPLSSPPRCECWTVNADVTSGSEGELRWSAGGGWRFIAIDVEESDASGIEAASDHAYGLLLAHVAAAPEQHLQRIWNYLDAINAGAGDQERYRLFCNGRARGLAKRGVSRYPAATAIGHRGPHGLLQVYALCATEPGHAMENPRQMSAWEYPRQYGPTAPSFARAMRLPGAAFAISGTAAIIGHASHHHDDVTAQADEAFANLASLLERAGLPAFDAHSPLKVYVRDADAVAAVEAALTRHLAADVPRVLLQGDICRRELLVEIDGWRFAP